MAFKSEAEENAEAFIEKVEGILRRQDGLIYGVDSSVGKSNVISPSKVGNRHAFVEVTLYNVSDPENVFDASTWLRLGEIGAGVDTHRRVPPVIEIFKSFDS